MKVKKLNDLGANNQAAKGTALQSDRIWQKHKKLSSSRNIRYAPSAENHISRMGLANRRQMTENRFHNDESSWKVFEQVEGKIGNKCWLWVSRSESVVFFQITPGRGADVPVEYFGNTQQEKIIVICDRFSAYKSLAKQLPCIILAFCWAHVRRDFLDAARKYPELEEWAFSWVEMIAKLYHINNRRREEFDPKLSLQQQTPSFNELHGQLVEKMMAEPLKTCRLFFPGK
jgi:hypothetical protein